MEARPVDRGGEDAERLLAALGVENHQSEFDWEKGYGFVAPRCSGWDVESQMRFASAFPFPHLLKRLFLTIERLADLVRAVTQHRVVSRTWCEVEFKVGSTCMLSSPTSHLILLNHGDSVMTVPPTVYKLQQWTFHS